MRVTVLPTLRPTPVPGAGTRTPANVFNPTFGPRFNPVFYPSVVPTYYPALSGYSLASGPGSATIPAAIPETPVRPTSPSSPFTNPYNNPAPPKESEPGSRLRCVQLDVTGLRSASDGAVLRISLDKLKGVTGATVKRKADGSATVKVWFSEKESVESDAIIAAAGKLGYTAVVSGSN